MSKREMTLVYYHVPEDKDDPECPNVYGVPAAKNSIDLSVISESFPLKGSYLFRFKQDHQGHVVWLDLPDVHSKIPLYKDRVVMKATRVSWQESKLHSQYRQKTSNVGAQSKGKAESVDFFSDNEHTKQEVKESRKVEKKEIHNLLDDHHEDSKEDKRQDNWLHGFESKGNDLI